MQAYVDIKSRIDGVIGPDTPEEERLRQQRMLEPYAARADEYRDRMAAEMTPLIVLGPEAVANAAQRWEEAARTTTGNPLRDRRRVHPRSPRDAQGAPPPRITIQAGPPQN